jgi:hypothetical protein
MAHAETLPRRLALLLCLLLALAGCRGASGGGSMAYSLGRRGGLATLTLGRSTILFEGVPFPGPDGEVMEGFFLVRGPGSTRGKSSANGITIEYSYSSGTTAVSVGSQRFETIEGGSRLRFGE